MHFLIKPKALYSLILLHLFEVLQTLFTAEGLGGVLQLQHERFSAAGGAAVLTDAHVVSAETLQTVVAAELLDGLVQGQLDGGLEKMKCK